MEYITIKEVADKWDLSVRRVQTLCNENKIDGAVRFGKVWAIPKEVEKPVDHRIKSGIYIKEKPFLDIKNGIEGATTPILKWAGGKTQMLGDIVQRMPRNYKRYIEPFIGGGALFFYLGVSNSLIADSNPELINLYKQVAENCEEVIEALQKYQNEEVMFYEVRAKNWKEYNPIEAAARMIFLNKTCFNGLYRLNKKGFFNTPFGKYKNPTICNAEKIRKASELLKKTDIICDDYLQVLEKHVNKEDFVFLDPPYVPISENSDFKRYTKEQFYEEDQRRLAKKVDELVNKGCQVMLTNSNHPLVYELYGNYNIEIIKTRRNINSLGDKRRGEDIIVRTYTK
jgi:DNA adenine methylase